MCRGISKNVSNSLKTSEAAYSFFFCIGGTVNSITVLWNEIKRQQQMSNQLSSQCFNNMYIRHNLKTML